MNSTQELKKVSIELDENQLCVLIACFNEGRLFNPESQRSDIREVRKILQSAIKEIF